MKKESDPKKARASKKTADAVAKPRDTPQPTDWVRWLREHRLPPGMVLPEPEAVNHELLVVMRELAEAFNLGRRCLVADAWHLAWHLASPAFSPFSQRGRPSVRAGAASENKNELREGGC